jgi:hypothetical protein
MKTFLLAMIVPLMLVLAFREPNLGFEVADLRAFARFCVDAGARLLPLHFR